MKQLFTLIFMFCMIGTANKVLAQEVKINTNLAIEGDGTIRMDNAATVWDDLRVSLTEPTTATNRPEWEKFPYKAAGGVPINWFRAGAINECYFVVQLPHDWAPGTDIMPHIHWVPSENGTTNTTLPKWGLQYTWANHEELFPNPYLTIYAKAVVTQPAPIIQANVHYITPLGTLSSGTLVSPTKKISSIIICRIFREGTAADDTYTGLAGALSVDFHYQRNTLGSRLEYEK